MTTFTKGGLLSHNIKHTELCLYANKSAFIIELLCSHTHTHIFYKRYLRIPEHSRLVLITLELYTCFRNLLFQNPFNPQ